MNTVTSQLKMFQTFFTELENLEEISRSPFRKRRHRVPIPTYSQGVWHLVRSEATKEGGPLATARGCRPPIYISTKRSSRPLSFYVNLPQTLWTKPSLNSNFTSISWDSSCRRTSCIPGQKTDLAHPPPKMAYTRGVSDLPFFMYRLSTIFG